MFNEGQEEVICDIHNRSFRFWIEKFGFQYGYRYIKPEEVLNWLKEKSSSIWIGYFKDQPVGYAHCFLEEKKKLKNTIFIETTESLGQSKIAVLPEFRHRGIGKALVTSVIDHHRHQGANAATVLVYSDNSSANSFLSKMGFLHERFHYDSRYSSETPFFHDSVLAELDFSKPIQEIDQNKAVIVRPVAERDLNAIKLLFGDSHPDVFGSDPSMEQIQEWFHSNWAEETLVAELDDKVIGCMGYSKTGVVGIPGVLKKYRKTGIGSTLFYHLLKSMQQKKVSKALADTGYVLLDAINMYKRFNFDLSRELWAWVKPIKE